MKKTIKWIRTIIAIKFYKRIFCSFLMPSAGVTKMRMCFLRLTGWWMWWVRLEKQVNNFRVVWYISPQHFTKGTCFREPLRKTQSSDWGYDGEHCFELRFEAMRQLIGSWWWRALRQTGEFGSRREPCPREVEESSWDWMHITTFLDFAPQIIENHGHVKTFSFWL